MEHVDVAIVGAGLSGIGVAYRLQTECPSKKYVILEQRSQLGGTWDLFRYPGVRSDSDMFTLGFPFHPWKDPKAIADGPSILRYIEETAREYGIDGHIRFGQQVSTARWSSENGRWVLEALSPETGVISTYEASWLYVCSGYYRYDHGYEPELPQLDRYGGQVIHPQHWPNDLDYAGKQVVVVGSGATAVTLVPAMAKTAAHVTMLQRSPTYIVTVPGNDRVADALRAHLPAKTAHSAVRWKNVALGTALYQYAQRRPEAAKRAIAKGIEKALPGYAVDPDFTPRYNPWDQRMCLVPDGDFFEAIKSKSASIVTDRITGFTDHAVQLESGKSIEADIVVTATGLEVLACGGIEITVDREPIDPGKTICYRGFMLSGVPNFAVAFGYTNASWTLRADLSARAVCRLLKHLESSGASIVVPTPPPSVVASAETILSLTSGYISRSAHLLPKQGPKTPWKTRHNYVVDLLDMKLGNATKDLVFGNHSSGPVALTEREAQYQP
jgi:monooxygenase